MISIWPKPTLAQRIARMGEVKAKEDPSILREIDELCAQIEWEKAMGEVTPKEFVLDFQKKYYEKFQVDPTPFDLLQNLPMGISDSNTMAVMSEFMQLPPTVPVKRPWWQRLFPWN